MNCEQELKNRIKELEEELAKTKASLAKARKMLLNYHRYYQDQDYVPYGNDDRRE